MNWPQGAKTPNSRGTFDSSPKTYLYPEVRCITLPSYFGEKTVVGAWFPWVKAWGSAHCEKFPCVSCRYLSSNLIVEKQTDAFISSGLMSWPGEQGPAPPCYGVKGTGGSTSLVRSQAARGCTSNLCTVVGWRLGLGLVEGWPARPRRILDRRQWQKSHQGLLTRYGLGVFPSDAHL